MSYGFDPFAFAFIQMGAGGVFMMWIGRRTSAARAVIASPLTWLYGMLRVATAAFFTAALVHTSTANAAFLGIISVPLAALATGVIFGKAPSRWELPGHAVVLAGLWLVAHEIDGGFANPAVLMMALSELCMVGATIIAAVHPVNKGQDEQSRAYLSGAVLIVSAAFLTLLLGATRFAMPALGVHGVAGSEADPSGFADWRLWLAAILVGIIGRGPSIYLSLRAIALTGAMTYVSAAATLPVVAFALEALFVAFDLLPAEPPQLRLLAYGLVAGVGSLLVVFARSYRSAR